MEDQRGTYAEMGVEAREKFALVKPRLSGFAKPVKFTDTQTAILNAAADRIVPGGEGFPWPHEVGIVNFIGRYVTPNGVERKHFPFAAEGDFKAMVDRLGEEFLSAGSTKQVEILEQIEREEEDFFSQLRNLVYYGYYAQPEVTKAINENLEAGRDYRSPPQPYGYLDVIEPWDESMFSRVEGTYIRTEDVERVEVRAPAQEQASAPSGSRTPDPTQEQPSTPAGSPAPAEEPSAPGES